ncbi:6657_t:CDS:10 [Entrophospora sp. SA101]|nr:6657_t:CDS:10 [Entrophospora sp. SA101]
MLSDTGRPGFSYFLNTPCEDWDVLQYHKAWKAAKLTMDKASLRYIHAATHGTTSTHVTEQAKIYIKSTTKDTEILYNDQAWKQVNVKSALILKLFFSFFMCLSVNHLISYQHNSSKQEPNKETIETLRRKRDYDEFFDEEPDESSSIEAEPHDEFDEDKFLKELITIEEVTNPVVKKLLNYGEGIARYKIIFLPEGNKQDPIKNLLTSQEWATSEHDWQMAEEKIIGSFSVAIPADIVNLLIKYDEAIKEHTIGFGSNVNKISLVINENPFEKGRTEYVFQRDWLLHWVQLVYTSFITCFQMPTDFFHDASLSEYAYRDRLINKLWEDIFLDVNPAIYMRTGEVENIDRKNQKDGSRPPGQKRATGWSHDAILMVKFLSKDIQVGFGEVVGNPCKHDDNKLNEDREKMLKVAKIIIRKKVQKKDLERLETFGIQRDFFIYSAHWVNGLYLVDQVNGFTIPDTANQLDELSSIIKAMLEFKYRIINLTNHIKSLLKHRPKTFGYRKAIDESAVDSSP